MRCDRVAKVYWGAPRPEMAAARDGTNGVIEINGHKVHVPNPVSLNTGFTAAFALRGSRWRVVDGFPKLHKRPGLQGPIDDAFMGRFLLVRPTGTAWHPAGAKWSEAARRTITRAPAISARANRDLFK